MAKRAFDHQVPRYGDFYKPVIAALKQLGGSATIGELNTKVFEIMNLPQDVLEVLHDPGKSNSTEAEYRLAWARTYLRIYGLLENSSRAVWSLSKAADSVEDVDIAEVRRIVNERTRKKGKPLKPSKNDEVEVDGDGEVNDVDSPSASWREELFAVLTKQMDPSAFERLVQRLLRESGFIQVEVTGRAGDGGIDGKGIARIHGLMSFHVVFQCKRYSGVVSPSQVRDFRGSMIGRADKGLFITTGTFSKEAAKEAIRDGAPPIDLLDGDALADKLKELGLGVRVKMVEAVEIDGDWFAGI
jgi:restriction system protein